MRKGSHMTKEQIERLSKAHIGQKAWNKGMSGYLAGEKHWKWQFKNPSYRAVHAWINKLLGSPRKCELCGTKNAKRFEWANISGLYKREVKDWMRLCKSCHNIFDETGYKSWQTRRRVIL